MRRAALVVGLVLLLAPSAPAQDRDTTFVSLLRGTALGVGALLQTDLNAGSGVQNDGFDLRAARLRFKGAVAPVQFFVQTDVTNTPVVVDTRIRLPLTPQVHLLAGLYKTPFSRELITFRGDILMAERSRAVNALAPARQLGAHLSLDLLPDRLTLEVGMFNGPQDLRPNDNGQFLYVGRLAGSIPAGATTLDVGANVGVSDDANVDLGSIASNFDGLRVLFGADAEVRTERWVLSGELVGACLDADRVVVDNTVADDTRCPVGGHLTGGFTTGPHEFRLRYDRFDPDRPGTGALEDRWTLGYAFLLSESVEGIVNYTAADDGDDGRFTLRLQVAVN